MKKYKIKSFHKKIISDTITPVSIYLKVRDQFPNCILLESSDYQINSNNYSYICFNPIAHIKVKNDTISYLYPDQKTKEIKISENDKISDFIHHFTSIFETTNYNFKFISNGLFGYIAHEAVERFESINLNKEKNDLNIPDLFYSVYQNVIAVSSFNHEAHIFCHSYRSENNISSIEKIINIKTYASYNFKKIKTKYSDINDNQFLELVKKAKYHCQRGDVFQLVLSRRFIQEFKGDEFNVYRALRSINPSPYLFYFDYGDFKIFGSSPEAQLVVEDGKAEIHPIAGTFKRTGNENEDQKLAKLLLNDPKENSEHVMLIDLARNDLGRNGTEVKVEKNREIQFFSHVIHLVSKVTSIKNPNSETFQLVADTFPAGTLTGAPKHMALKLIDRYEINNRNFYGGAIGYMDFNGNFNHAITIRSFMSKDYKLHYQAGAGIVSKSEAKKELEEIYNKLGALDNALSLAENI
ncbi:MAG: anthranilate synthase component I [Flavobacteriaceae bacterium]|nr:anthranilate synthase component I [Flavobacteriaceae bacterium]|tara:strand:- start:452 stop:1852 length:1401 start_codon:yes stop_codon:yes gene_type:complete